MHRDGQLMKLSDITGLHLQLEIEPRHGLLEISKCVAQPFVGAVEKGADRCRLEVGHRLHEGCVVIVANSGHGHAERAIYAGMAWSDDLLHAESFSDFSAMQACGAAGEDEGKRPRI